MVEVQELVACPACGTDLSRERWSGGLCPACLIELALDDTGLEAELLIDPEEAPTLQFSAEGFSEGDIQGDRYRVRSLLGRGGMGEVWRAYDLKLRQDVALKALRSELVEDPAALEILRQEVRVAREVISPNVCRVFDLQEVKAQELISMEYVDGTTLQEILRDRGPLELNEAREIATQFLAGLEAIHDAGLVHRDIKPENLMITRTGRVVVMDFGIAKGLGEGKGGVVAGTPAYMSPEQARGQELDARTDLFSAGVVLAEMVQPGGIGTFEDRKRVWEGIHQDTPQISETPWSRVIAKAVSAETRDRFESASALARALEEVTLRAAGDETARPYPGLSAFQQEDAEFFYGRELEVEAVWKKLRRPHLLAVIGPSGAGKSSFLRAGLLPTLTDGWQAVIATPGNRPFANLARVLAEQLPEDRPTVDALLGFEDPDVAIDLISQWRQGHKHGLIILDQFEELFTQNPDEIQWAFAELLGRLPLEADVFVLLSMRDDFLHRCSELESLAPVFSELSPLKSLSGASLRRAIVEPALKCGYRFEDESIVEEMLGEVEGQRGALPLLAFAAAQLWERRDRESGLLTRKSYEQIGGVSGALAQHAEAMLDYIGEANVPIVRELFRNLVTAQGTRSSREREELLSVFPETEGEPFPEPSEVRPTPVHKPQRPAAKHVLNSLIDARLLTSYEIPSDEEGGEPHHQIEIVHESLLVRWPRLVRWQRQDADSAQMRDELRAQAKLWDEHGRSEDYLWTGTAFKEYALWRESYPGGLTEVEEAFGASMVRLAERHKRRRRIAVTAVIAALVLGLSVVGGFWRQAEQERRRAEAESLRAEAGKLLALGELAIDSYPTAALAWATRSLELTDTQEGRMLALRALHQGPPATVLEASPEEGGRGGLGNFVFSPTWEWLATANSEKVWLRHRDGGEAIPIFSYPTQGQGTELTFQEENVLVAEKGGELRWFSVPDGKEIRRVESEHRQLGFCGKGYVALTVKEGQESFHWWPLGEGKPRVLTQPEASISADPECLWLAFSREDNVLFLRSLENWDLGPRKIGQHDADLGRTAFHTDGERVAANDASGQIRIWSMSESRPFTGEPLRTIQESKGPVIQYDRSGRWLAGVGVDGGYTRVWLWDMAAPEEVEPLVLARSDATQYVLPGPLFHPTQPWMVLNSSDSAAFWHLEGPYPWVLRAGVRRVWDLAISPDGDWLISVTASEGVRAWPLRGQNEGGSRALLKGATGFYAKIAFHPSGEHVALASGQLGVLLIPMSGGAVREMPEDAGAGFLAFSPDGRFLATVAYEVPEDWAEAANILVWDLQSDQVTTLGPLPSRQSGYLAFADDRQLRWSGPGTGAMPGGEVVFDVEDGSVETVAEQGWENLRVVSSSGEFMFVYEVIPENDGHHLLWKSLRGAEPREITSHGDASEMTALAIDPSDRWFATGDGSGLIRIGPVSGEEPHLLIGHEGPVNQLAFSPDGQTVASAGNDGTVRVWPVPDLSKAPLHTLPHDELIAKLHSLTNLRIVEDAESSTGWKLNYAPFPGWEEIPTWP